MGFCVSGFCDVFDFACFDWFVILGHSMILCLVVCLRFWFDLLILLVVFPSFVFGVAFVVGSCCVFCLYLLDFVAFGFVWFGVVWFSGFVYFVLAWLRVFGLLNFWLWWFVLLWVWCWYLMFWFVWFTTWLVFGCVIWCFWFTCILLWFSILLSVFLGLLFA